MSDTIENKAVKLSDLTSVTQLIKDYTDEKDTNKVDKIEGKSLLDDTEIERLKGVNNYDDTEVKENIAEVKTDVTKLSSQIAENVNLINARMDTFTKLEEGSTTADAEIADIRIGADGTTYENAGEAVRGQVNNLKQDLANTKNELKDILKTEIGINKIKEMYPLSTLSGLIVGNIYQNPFATNKVDNTNVDISGLIDIEKDKSYYFYSIANDDGGENSIVTRNITSTWVFDKNMKFLGSATVSNNSVTSSYEDGIYLIIRIGKGFDLHAMLTETSELPTEYMKYEEKHLLYGEEPLSKDDIDTTLTKSGKVADAKAVSDKINETTTEFDNKINELKASQWFGKIWAQYGDSITAISNGNGLDLGWTKYVNNILGFGTCYGRGIGGTKFRWGTKGAGIGFINADGTLHSRDASISLEDYIGTPPDGTKVCRLALSSWSRIIAMFPESIKDNIDLLFVMGGTNDVHDLLDAQWVENDVTDPEWALSSYYSTYCGDYDLSTIKGGIASTVMKLQAWMPQAIIVLGTNLNGQTNKTGTIKPSEIPDEWNKAKDMIEVAQRFGIPCIDVFGTCGINTLNSLLYITDGTHPYNEKGKMMLGRTVASGLKNIYPMLV